MAIQREVLSGEEILPLRARMWETADALRFRENEA